jgi:hypothetical protein
MVPSLILGSVGGRGFGFSSVPPVKCWDSTPLKHFFSNRHLQSSTNSYAAEKMLNKAKSTWVQWSYEGSRTTMKHQESRQSGLWSGWLVPECELRKTLVHSNKTRPWAPKSGQKLGEEMKTQQILVPMGSSSWFGPQTVRMESVGESTTSVISLLLQDKIPCLIAILSINPELCFYSAIWANNSIQFCLSVNSLLWIHESTYTSERLRQDSKSAVGIFVYRSPRIKGSVRISFPKFTLGDCVMVRKLWY